MRIPVKQVDQYTNIYKYPYSSIGYLLIRFQGHLQAFANACLIQKNIALTCAPNVYSRTLKKQATSVYFYPSLNSKHKKQFKVIQFFYLKQYQTALQIQKSRYQMAILYLGNIDLSQTYGFLEIEKQWKGQEQMMIYGYSKDKPNQIYGDFSKYNELTNTQIYYSIFTSPGQSGSPIIIKNQIYPWYQVAGIRIKKHKDVLLNCGLKITKDILQLFKKILKQQLKKLSLLFSENFDLYYAANRKLMKSQTNIDKSFNNSIKQNLNTSDIIKKPKKYESNNLIKTDKESEFVQSFGMDNSFIMTKSFGISDISNAILDTSFTNFQNKNINTKEQHNNYFDKAKINISFSYYFEKVILSKLILLFDQNCLNF